MHAEPCDCGFEVEARSTRVPAGAGVAPRRVCRHCTGSRCGTPSGVPCTMVCVKGATTGRSVRPNLNRREACLMRPVPPSLDQPSLVEPSSSAELLGCQECSWYVFAAVPVYHYERVCRPLRKGACAPREFHHFLRPVGSPASRRRMPDGGATRRSRAPPRDLRSLGRPGLPNCRRHWATGRAPGCPP